MTYFDTNVIFDLLGEDPAWADRSAAVIARTVGARRLAPVAFAELSGRFATIDALERELDLLEIAVTEPFRAALFLAGQAHVAYRRRGGPRERVLPDFLIGAQAATEGAALVTRDPRRYRTAFPDLLLVTP